MKTFLTTLCFACFSVAAASAADAAAGQAVYNSACKACHGADGIANPSLAKMMKVEIHDLKAPEVQALSDTEMKNIVTAGKGKMRPVASVSGADADNVVGFVRSLKK